MSEGVDWKLRNVRGVAETSRRIMRLTNDGKPDIIEVGFITNPNERYLLKQNWYQEKLSNIILSGIIKYFS